MRLFPACDLGWANFVFLTLQLSLNLFRYSAVTGLIEQIPAAQILHLNT
jgi:hypothetical protein